MYVWKALKPGGILVYSTCAVTPEENEDVVLWFLENHSDVELVSGNLDSLELGLENKISKEKSQIDLKKIILNEKQSKLSEGNSKTIRILPQADGLNPMFMAVLRKVKQND